MNETLTHEPVMASISDEIFPAPAEHIADAPPVVEPLLAQPVEPLSLEKRLAHLEQMLMNLKPAVDLEERIANRVLERLPQAMDSPRWYQRMNLFRKPVIPAPSGWIVFDLLNEIRFVAAMLFDRSFAMSWTSRGVVVASLVVAFTLPFWLSPLGFIPLIGSTMQWILQTLLILLCGGVIFKIFHREALRYRGSLENRSS